MADWRHWAVCREEDPELFFPVGTSGPALKQIADAKAVCRRCPVITECLTWALETGQDAGVWGGLSEDERRALKRRARQTTRQAKLVEQGTRRSATRADVRAAGLALLEDGVPVRDVADWLGVSQQAVRRWQKPGRNTPATPVRRELAAALHALRVEEGVSLRKLAGRLGWSQSKVTKTDRGITAPKPGEAAAWACALGAPTDERRRLAALAARVRSEARTRAVVDDAAGVSA